MNTKSLNTIQIEIPNGFVFDYFDEESSAIKFKAQPKEVKERIKSIADVLADNGLTQQQFDEQCKSLEPDEIGYRLVKLITKSLNEGWVPDWNDSNQTKYVPWFYMGGSSGFQCNDCDDWRSRSVVGSRLCFKSRDLAIYAANQFTSTYKLFML